MAAPKRHEQFTRGMIVGVAVTLVLIALAFSAKDRPNYGNWPSRPVANAATNSQHINQKGQLHPRLLIEVSCSKTGLVQRPYAIAEDLPESLETTMQAATTVDNDGHALCDTTWAPSSEVLTYRFFTAKKASNAAWTELGHVNRLQINKGAWYVILVWTKDNGSPPGLNYTTDGTIRIPVPNI